MTKGIAGKNAQKNVQPTKKDNHNPYNTRIPGESLGAKHVRSP